MRCVPTKEERELLDIVEPYAVYPPVNGYPVRPDAPKEVFDALEKLWELDRKLKEENE
ncbi:MAG: hypothetical protein J6I46_05900 [Ruminococcus sp.]|nr:hypothetical protein [Ruminococcus sp.]